MCAAECKRAYAAPLCTAFVSPPADTERFLFGIGSAPENCGAWFWMVYCCLLWSKGPECIVATPTTGPTAKRNRSTLAVGTRPSVSVHPQGAGGSGRGRTGATGAVGAGLGCPSTLCLALALPLAPSLPLDQILRPGGYALLEGLVGIFTALAPRLGIPCRVPLPGASPSSHAVPCVRTFRPVRIGPHVTAPSQQTATCPCVLLPASPHPKSQGSLHPARCWDCRAGPFLQPFAQPQGKRPSCSRCSR